MKKIKKNILYIIAVGIYGHTLITANAFQQNAFFATGAALAIGSVHLLCKRVSSSPKKQYYNYTYDLNAGLDSLPPTRTKSFKRNRLKNCSEESPDFYVESKRILTRTAGALGLVAGLYIILNGKEMLEKFNRAQTAFTWIGYWDSFKNWAGSFFTTA